MIIGLTEILIESFPEITLKEITKRQVNIRITSPYWIKGLTKAEGCFFLFVHKSNYQIVGYQTQFCFTVVQHKDLKEGCEKLIEIFIKYIAAKPEGASRKIKQGYNKTSISFLVTKLGLPYLKDKIIPRTLFSLQEKHTKLNFSPHSISLPQPQKKYTLVCSKILEFRDFFGEGKKRGFFLVKSYSNLNDPGLNPIPNIKTGNNKGASRSEIKPNKDTNIYKIYPPSLLKGATFFIQKREFHHHIVKAKNRIGPHNIDIVSVIIGSLLGNSQMKRLVEGSMLVVKETDKDYAQWLYTFFYSRGYTSNLHPRQYTISIRSKEGKVSHGYEFNTFTFRSFSWIHKMFYKNGRKVIPLNIYDYLTPLALAVWIMDDGCFTNYGIRIATNSYKLKEVELLNDAIKSKYNLETTIKKKGIKDQYYIYIKKESVHHLRNIVGPFIHSSKFYKLGIDSTYSSSFNTHTYI